MPDRRIGVHEIAAAQERLRRFPQFVRTPLVYSQALTDRLQTLQAAGTAATPCRVWLKLESLQTGGSFKLRGAYNNIGNLPDEVRARGLITASAGNHAQAVALIAAAFGIAARTEIFVPERIPAVKLRNTERHGVVVRRVGDNFDEARDVAYREAERSGRVFIEPFENWDTIAGAGTVGVEIVEDLPTVDTIAVPVGGGGLVAGIVAAVAAHSLSARVVGVQAAQSASMVQALQSGVITRLAHPSTIADGILVAEPGRRTFVLLRDTRTEVVTVREAEILAAIADLILIGNISAEGAGAVGYAGLVSGKIDGIEPTADVVVVVSGSNIDPGLLVESLAIDHVSEPSDRFSIGCRVLDSSPSGGGTAMNRGEEP